MFKKTTESILSVFTKTIAELEKHIKGQDSTIDIHELMKQANQSIIDRAVEEKTKATRALNKLKTFLED